jgi:hypothetical protein
MAAALVRSCSHGLSAMEKPKQLQRDVEAGVVTDDQLTVGELLGRRIRRGSSCRNFPLRYRNET